MGTTKSSIPLPQTTLTNAFSVIGSPLLIAQESMLSLNVSYTTGASETASTLELQAEFSADGENNWVPESLGTAAMGITTLTPNILKVVGGTGSTTYRFKYFLPNCSRYLRISALESGVITNFGSVLITITTSSASGQSQNL